MVLLLDAFTDPEAAHYLRTQARAHIERRGICLRNGQLVLADRPDTPVVKFPG